MHTLQEYSSAKVLVIIFMCNHCPYVQKIWTDMVELVVSMHEGVQFVGINSNANSNYPEDSFEKMSKYAKEKGHNFPYLYDEHQKQLRLMVQFVRPIFVYDAQHKLSYQGTLMA